MPPRRETRTVEVRQWTPGIKPTWTVSEVRTALRLHADGDFSQSALLVDAMGEDDVLPGILDKRIDSVLSRDFELLPVEEPNRQFSTRLANKYEPIWWDMFPESEVGALMRWRRMLGVGIGVLDWERGSSSWEARLRVLHPQFLHYRQFDRKWIYSAEEGQLEVTPGDGKWVLLTSGQRGWMQGAVRSLAINWLAKQQTIRDWNRFNERHGLPIIKAMAPLVAEDPEREQFWEDIATLGSETVAQLPTHLNKDGAAFDLGLLEATARSWDSFKLFLERCDRRFMVLLLGSNLSTEIDAQGSRAAAEVHQGAEDTRAAAEAEELGTELRRQGLHPICGANFAGATLDVTPWPTWHTESDADPLTEAQQQAAFLGVISAATSAGFDIENIDELAERHGLKLVKKPEPVAAPEPVVAPSADEQAEEEDDAEEAEEPAVGLAVVAKRRSRAMKPPTKAGEAYEAALAVVSKAFGEAVRKYIIPQVEKFAATEDAKAAADGDAREAVNKARGAIEANARAIRAAAKKAAASTDEHSRDELTRLGVNVRKAAPGIGKLIDGWRSDNVAKVQSLLGAELDTLERILSDGDGRTAAALAEEIEERIGVTASKAETLARDQVLTLNSQISHHRMRAAGVTRGRWMTSGDERVRESHRAMDGNEFEIDDPPEVDGEKALPGEPPLCRCTTEPVLDELEETEPSED